MKKLTALFALFTLVLMTSFVQPTDIGGKNQTIGKTTIKFSSTCEIGGKGQLAG
jgi:hypothetical protein